MHGAARPYAPGRGGTRQALIFTQSSDVLGRLARFSQPRGGSGNILARSHFARPAGRRCLQRLMCALQGGGRFMAGLISWPTSSMAGSKAARNTRCAAPSAAIWRSAYCRACFSASSAAPSWRREVARLVLVAWTEAGTWALPRSKVFNLSSAWCARRPASANSTSDRASNMGGTAPESCVARSAISRLRASMGRRGSAGGIGELCGRPYMIPAVPKAVSPATRPSPSRERFWEGACVLENIGFSVPA